MESNSTYRFPFTFVVPHQLLPQTCVHAKKSLQVERAHLIPPPSLGDLKMFDKAKHKLDDMAPEMSRIGYMIHARVLQKSISNFSSDILADYAKAIRIMPITPDDELFVEASQGLPEYRQTSRMVRNHLMTRKDSQLTASVSKYLLVELQPSSLSPRRPSGTVIHVNLKYSTSTGGNDSENPPQIESVKIKLRAHTFYGIAPNQDFPNYWDYKSLREAGGDMFTAKVPITTLKMSKIQWEKKSSTCTTENESPRVPESLSTQTGDTEGSAGIAHFTSSLEIPLMLPVAKFIVPTFHSCLISRTYSVKLNLSYRKAAKRNFLHTFSLCIPVTVKACPRYVSSMRSNST